MDFFITEYLVASYYLAGKFEEFDRLVSQKVNLSDIKATMLGIYSYVLLDKNELYWLFNLNFFKF